ncbi:MAG: protein-lysine N-methyltransferase [Flavipsychrobacter sp.]|nr:protein-lysine N-methyltransferase [Flavipsychrobacter sp.]
MRNKITIRKSKIQGAGRGVFATDDIKKGEVLEICPVLIFNKKDTSHIMDSSLNDYVYAYDKGQTMFVLGYGSLYNHSNTPNAKYELLVEPDRAEKDNEFCFTAIKPIRKNEEIYISYGTDHFS